MLKCSCENPDCKLHEKYNLSENLHVAYFEKNIKIEKNVLIPKKTTCKKYPFEEMEVGDSFIIGDYTRELMSKYFNAANNWSKKGKYGYKFSVRKTDDCKVRIWRIK